MNTDNRFLQTTIQQVFNYSTKTYPSNLALSFIDDNEYTYSQLSIKAKEVSFMLNEMNIKKGDRVIIVGENSPEWSIAYFAAAYLGCVLVPILPDFSHREIEGIVEHSEAKAIFVSSRLYRKLNENIRNSQIPIIKIEDYRVLNQTNINSIVTNKVGLSSTEIALAKTKEFNSFKPEIVHEDDLASIIYTSGTTGMSKGVMLTNKNIISNVKSSMLIQKVGVEDRFLSILPLSHTYEQIMGFFLPIISGASIYYLGKLPTASNLLPALKKIRPTIMLTVPLIIEKIYKTKILPKLTSSRVMKLLFGIKMFRKIFHRKAGKAIYELFGGKLHFFGVGGASLSPYVEQFLIDAKFPYAIGYGLTETSPMLAGATPDIVRFRSTGPAVPMVEIKIINADKNGEGEIIARGPNIMKGYYKNEKATAEVFTEDGWFKTGDLGVFDKDKFLYIKGRSKNMILGPSGENIYPEEIEAVLNKYKYVSDAVVFEKKGRLVAMVHLNAEEVEKQFQHLKESASQMQEKFNEIILDIKLRVNQEVNKFSRLSSVILQAEPFVKTPTKKIKRYLYVD